MYFVLPFRFLLPHLFAAFYHLVLPQHTVEQPTKEVYLETRFWDDLRFFARYVLERQAL
jgi:hypothetical protein